MQVLCCFVWVQVQKDAAAPAEHWMQLWSVDLKSFMTQMTQSWGVLLCPLACMEAQTAEGYHTGDQQGCSKRSSKSFQ